MKFRCKNCNYQFSSESDATKKNCGNCGQKSIVREQSAEELLVDNQE
ncbi:MAG TPA: hypothetical protein P5277_03170 [Candidatus Paceibacterota bacterium]|nr:hypothetical protein [Candidatus Paceibacterota bacterium]